MHLMFLLTPKIVMIDGETGRVMAIYERHPSRQEEIKPKKVFN